MSDNVLRRIATAIDEIMAIENLAMSKIWACNKAIDSLKRKPRCEYVFLEENIPFGYGFINTSSNYGLFYCAKNTEPDDAPRFSVDCAQGETALVLAANIDRVLEAIATGCELDCQKLKTLRDTLNTKTQE